VLRHKHGLRRLRSPALRAVGQSVREGGASKHRLATDWSNMRASLSNPFPLRIFIVEDHTDTLHTLRLYLEFLGISL
jgi:hypothetical protein